MHNIAYKNIETGKWLVISRSTRHGGHHEYDYSWTDNINEASVQMIPLELRKLRKLVEPIEVIVTRTVKTKREILLEESAKVNYENSNKD